MHELTLWRVHAMRHLRSAAGVGVIPDIYAHFAGIE